MPTPTIPADAELILHVGAPKTGSSAIQRVFSTHSAALARQGIHYPPHPFDSNGVSGGHGDIVSLVLDGQVAAARRALEAHLTAARRRGCRLFVSAENACAQAERIVPILPTPRFHVVCFARHPLDALASHHNQGIKRHAGRGSLEQTAAVVLSRTVPNPALSGAAILTWLRLVGHARLTVLPYVVHGAAVDAPARLAELIGATLPPEVMSSVTNSSYTPAAVRLKRLVNHLPAPLLAPLDAPLDLALQAYSDARGIVRQGIGDCLPAATVEALDAQFQGTVAQLEQAFGITLECRRAATPRAGEGTAADSVAAAWAHVARTGTLGDRLRGAVAAALRTDGPTAALVELAGIVGVEAPGEPPRRDT